MFHRDSEMGGGGQKETRREIDIKVRTERGKEREIARERDKERERESEGVRKIVCGGSRGIIIRSIISVILYVHEN